MTQRMPTPPRDRDRAWLRWLLSAVVPALLVWLAPPAKADEKPADKPAAKADAKGDAKGKPDQLDNEPAQWMRFVDDGHGGGKLEVAVGTYKNDDGVTVHLVGAIHIADHAYYEGLNKEFEGYDALLYEMVKPAGAGAPQKGMRGKSMIGMLQRFMKDQLDLDYQLDGIDYTRKNFVHADLDAETFEKLQEERGESILGLMVQQMAKEVVRQMEGKGGDNPGGDVNLLDLINAFDSPDGTRQMKLILGKSFGQMEEQMAGFQGTVLVTERNKKALSVLKETIRAGKKNVGIFYGAAHMPDIESRLALMGFRRTGVEWRTAWDLTQKPDEKK